VPAHFPTDIHGLAQFDGTALYEHADPRQGFHQDWNTLIFNFGRREVANYLIAAALSWLDRFHVDGLRVDAVASMLYLDYSRAPGAWIPNEQGGRENWDAVRFLQRFNQAITDRFDGVVTTAEESTAWPGVTRPVAEGGLGFGFKWNMGWMHDTLRYFGRDPIYRRHHQHDLTFGLVYAFSEKFILPLSHDEVVHGKGSLRTKMPGTPTQALANLRAYFGFMWAHPGKKLLFMGGEFAQQREWNHDFALDWTLLADPGHRGVQTLVRDLNELYRAEKALHERDAEPEGFDWIDIDDADRNVISFVRYGRDARDCALVVCNFSGASHFGYRVGAPFAGRWEECVNTDAAEYGGSGLGNLGGASTQPVPWQGRAQSLELTLPASATLVFAFRG
jgi:1,4-alpha-glucan branching enzyme